ncbi:divergent polysaccharide deacetylase family protein [Pseudoroseomonas globiformis]|uniref:Divergent polysaccharide deacetylase family protein n=1 Tax=Teichococcus globiformis TaxID=2307229 RepID=A0ABV7G1M0_9PROT
MSGSRLAWRALGLFWLLVLGGACGGVALLHSWGPPPEAVPGAPATLPSPLPNIHSHAPPPMAAEEPLAAPELGGDPQTGGTVQDFAATPLPPAAPAEPWRAPPEAPPPPPLAQRAGPTTGGAIAPPQAALLEPSAHGPLPRIGADGRQPREAYAAAFRDEGLPRIALVIGGFAESPLRAEEAIRRLPAGVTLAFSPLAPQPDALLEQARQRGLEVVMALPLDSSGTAPGAHVLRASLGWTENQERLERALGRFAGYAGTIGAVGGQRGERFTANEAQRAALEAALQRRGLFFIDARPGVGDAASVDQILDEPLTGGEVQYRLQALEAVARQRGHAIGLAAEPAPLLVERIVAWAAGLGARGLALAPASAVVQPPAIESTR